MVKTRPPRMPRSTSSHITIIQPARNEMVTIVMMKSSAAEKSSSSRSPAMKGCHNRKRPKWMSSHTRWKSPPGCETSAACSASSIASTTQRRLVESETARCCAIDGRMAKGAFASESRQRLSAGRTLRQRVWWRLRRIVAEKQSVRYVAWRLQRHGTGTHNAKEKHMKSQQSGFTLVEIAIVLVIIGLLLGGILKGQELINSAKVKNLANDFRTIPTYIYAYQDKFKSLPGDDVNVTAHVSGATAATTPGTLGN